MPSGKEFDALLESFYRATPDKHSAGLGLYIARLIVEAHRGRIVADGEIGRQARFVFCCREPMACLEAA